MGIPGFFKNCIVNYNTPNDPQSVIKTELNSSIDDLDGLNNTVDEQIQNQTKNTNNSKVKLFLDFNCAIYYVLKPEFKDEDTLIVYTLEYLDTLVKVCKDVDLLFIALDGVPPRAKMEQQRSRRFHSVCKKKKANEKN